jgi:hypothetical protein
MSSFTDDLLVKVLAEERNGLGLFEVAEPFAFDIGFLGSGETITVPIGFRTDFASIPWFGPLRPLLAAAGAAQPRQSGDRCRDPARQCAREAGAGLSWPARGLSVRLGPAAPLHPGREPRRRGGCKERGLACIQYVDRAAKREKGWSIASPPRPRRGAGGPARLCRAVAGRAGGGEEPARR